MRIQYLFPAIFVYKKRENKLQKENFRPLTALGTSKLIKCNLSGKIIILDKEKSL